MLTQRLGLMIRFLVLTALLTLGAVARSNAIDNAKLSPQEGQQMLGVAMDWLALLDGGKYTENFAAASQSFRKDFSVEKWVMRQCKKNSVPLSPAMTTCI